MLDLNYPIIICSESYIYGQITNKNRLCISTLYSVNSSMFDNCVIYDSNGIKYTVVNYSIESNLYVSFINFFDGLFTLFSRPEEDKRVWLDFKLEKVSELSSSDCFKEIKSLIKAHPKWFKKSHEDFDTVDQMFDSFDSIEDMISYIAGYP